VALWIRRVSKKGIVFHSLRHTMATLLARAKMHPSVAQKTLRHANIETTLAIYRAPNYARVRCAASLLRWPGVSGTPPARTTGCRCRSLRVIW